jgi:ATP-binding cassette subfamily F protein 3
MREALTIALQETEAGMVLVSHDRHLLRTTADSLYLVADRGCKLFDGDLDDYANWLTESRQAAVAPDAAKAQRKETRAAEEKSRQEKLAQRRPLLKEADQLEKKLSGWQAEKNQLEQRLADPALYTNPDRALLESLTKRQAELSHDIETAEMRWLEIHELLEG